MKLAFLLIFSLLSLPGLCQEDDDELLRQLEADRKKQTELAVELDKTQQKLKVAAFNAPEELQKLGYEAVTAASLMDEKVVRLVKRMMEESPLKNSSREDLKQLVLDGVRGKPFESIVRRPKILDVIVDVLKDQKALSSLVGLFLRRDDLKKYFYIWLGIIFFAWSIKKFWIKKQKKWSGHKILLMCLLVSFISIVASFSIFYSMFHDELSPTTNILVSHWRKRNL